MKKINGAINYRVNKRDTELFHETDKMDKKLEAQMGHRYDLMGQICGADKPLSRQKWKAFDTYWKDED